MGDGHGAKDKRKKLKDKNVYTNIERISPALRDWGAKMSNKNQLT